MLLLLLVALQVSPDADAALDRYRVATRATIECGRSNPDDITICSRRQADRWRVPLTQQDPNDPRTQNVPLEREKLFARTNNCQEKSTFLVGCGMAGVSASTRTGVGLIGERPIAP